VLPAFIFKLLLYLFTGFYGLNIQIIPIYEALYNDNTILVLKLTAGQVPHPAVNTG